MLPAVARHAIAAYTNPGDLVLDPLAGIGTTLVEAVHTGRDAIGIEYEPGWAILAEANLKLAASQGATGHGMITQADATRLPDLIPPVMRGRVALVLTSPPYGRTMHGRVEHRHGPLTKFANRYSEPDPANLAHRGLAGIRDGLAAVLNGCVPLLRSGGIVVVTARPWRRNGVLVDLPIRPSGPRPR
jgi:modification methylase